MNESQMMVLELGSKGYSCAQILFIGALRMFGAENPLLIRSMGALTQGGGNSGKTCGALVGGYCLLSLYAGKGNDFENPLPSEAMLWEELETWFNAEFCVKNDATPDNKPENKQSTSNTQSTDTNFSASCPTNCTHCIDNSCDAILGITSSSKDKGMKDKGMDEETDTHNSRMALHAERCGIIVAKTWDKCCELLVQYGLDPFDPFYSADR